MLSVTTSITLICFERLPMCLS